MLLKSSSYDLTIVLPSILAWKILTFYRSPNRLTFSSLLSKIFLRVNDKEQSSVQLSSNRAHAVQQTSNPVSCRNSSLGSREKKKKKKERKLASKHSPEKSIEEPMAPIVPRAIILAAFYIQFEETGEKIENKRRRRDTHPLQRSRICALRDLYIRPGRWMESNGE